MSKQEKENLTIIEDLPVDQTEQDEVKGGSGFCGTPAFKIVIDPRVD